MRALRQALVVLGSGLAAFLLLVGPIDWSPSFGWPFAGTSDDGSDTSASPDDESDESSDDSGDKSRCDTSPGRVVSDYLYDQGFSKRNFIVGAQVIDWSLLDTGHVQDPFSDRLTSEPAVVEFLSGDSRASKRARQIAGIADDYVPVQFSEGIRYSENWYWNGHRAVKGGDLKVRAHDVWWLAVTDDCEVSEESSIRAICGNPGVYWLRPAVDPRD